jgi:hypothetical protein
VLRERIKQFQLIASRKNDPFQKRIALRSIETEQLRSKRIAAPNLEEIPGLQAVLELVQKQAMTLNVFSNLA